MASISLNHLGLDMTKLPERLRQLRTDRGLTQIRLAELMAINPRVYNRWEQGVSIPHVDTLIRLADILQVSLDELAGRVDIQSQPLVHNHKLQTMYKELDHLSDEDQQVIIVLIDSLIKRNKFSEILRE